MKPNRFIRSLDTENSGGLLEAIDTHVHFWKFDKKRDAWITNDMKVLRDNFYPEHFNMIAHRNHVDGLVAVQADQSELETHFLVELAKTHPIIKGVVGWIDLRSPGFLERLDYFSQYPIIKGWRHIVQGEPDGFLLDHVFQSSVKTLGERNYTYDILVYHHQLKDVLPFVEALPDQKLVIDHCAKPDIANGVINEWAKNMLEIARHPNVYCKLSGLFTEAKWKNWTAADFYPYLDVVFKAFGTDRLLYGSDWPVILLSGIYVQWKSLLEKYMEHFKAEDKEKIFRTNAIDFYSLG